MITAALSSNLACEVINDGIHVHPAITALVARTPQRLVLVTDAIAAAGVGDGEFVPGGQQVRVGGGEARLTSTGSPAGSTLIMDAAVRRPSSSASSPSRSPRRRRPRIRRGRSASASAAA